MLNLATGCCQIKQSCGEPALQPQIIVHGDGDLLFRTEISLGRLDGGVPKQELDLLQISTILPAQLRTGPAQIMCSEVLDPNLLR